MAPCQEVVWRREPIPCGPERTDAAVGPGRSGLKVQTGLVLVAALLCSARGRVRLGDCKSVGREPGWFLARNGLNNPALAAAFSCPITRGGLRVPLGESLILVVHCLVGVWMGGVLATPGLGLGALVASP